MYLRKASAKPAGKKCRVPLAVKILGGLLVLLFAAAFAFIYLYPYVFPGVTVGSIPVSGLDRSAAADKIEQQSADLYKDRDVSVTIYETTYDIPVEDVLEGVDGVQSAENAFAIGRTGNPFARMWDVIRAAAGRAAM